MKRARQQPTIFLATATGLPDPGSGYALVGDVSDAPPAGFNPGLLWFGLRLDRLVVRYNDATVWSAWRELLGAGGDAYLDLSAMAPTAWADLAAQAVLDVEGEIWLDVEDAVAATPNVLDPLLATLSVPGITGIYTRADIWTTLGNPQYGQYTELWDANWTTPASCNVWYGGWARARQVQYLANVNVAGLLVDLSAREG